LNASASNPIDGCLKFKQTDVLAQAQRAFIAGLLRKQSEKLGFVEQEYFFISGYREGPNVSISFLFGWVKRLLAIIVPAVGMTFSQSGVPETSTVLRVAEGCGG
jgi:hypothetical protein